MKNFKVDPKKVIKREPLMIKEGGGYEWLVVIIPIAIIILTLIL